MLTNVTSYLGLRGKHRTHLMLQLNAGRRAGSDHYAQRPLRAGDRDAETRDVMLPAVARMMVGPGVYRGAYRLSQIGSPRARVDIRACVRADFRLNRSCFISTSVVCPDHTGFVPSVSRTPVFIPL